MSYPLTIAGCCRELLDASSEPLPLAELVAHAVTLGRTAARYPEFSVASALRGNPHVLQLEGDRFISVARLLEGRVLTTRSAEHLDPSLPSPRSFDLRPFASLEEPATGDLDVDEELLVFRCRSGRMVVETLDGGVLADAAALVENVQPRLKDRQPWQRDIAREVLLACAEDDALLRDPAAPLSELFPDFAPKASAPRTALPAQRTCPNCGWAAYMPGRAFDPMPYDDWSMSYDEASQWRDRIARLEDVVFSGGSAMTDA